VRDDIFYLMHMDDCISRIEEFTAQGKGPFITSMLIQDAVLRNLQILAQSSQRLSEGFKEAHSDIEWREMVAFRNILVHGYLGVDIDQVWQVVERELPILKRHITTMLEELG